MKEDRFYDVPGLEQFYEISVSGVVRAKPRYTISLGGVRQLRRQRELKVRLNNGYPFFRVCVGGRRHGVYVHRALAQLFIPNPEGKRTVNHIDGNKANFDLPNLEWCTYRENTRHAHATGLARPTPPGEKCPASKLKNAEVRDIRRRLRRGEAQRSIARAHGVRQSAISCIATGKTWRHVA